MSPNRRGGPRDGRLKRIEQVQSPPKPLGWTGKYVVDEHADGTRTYRWRVRLVDFDQPKGTILSQVDRLDYRIVFEDQPGKGGDANLFSNGIRRPLAMRE